MSLSALIEEALLNPAVHPTVGPRLTGITLGDILYRTLEEMKVEYKD